MSPIEPTITPQVFVDRWSASTGGERQSSQSHFNDLCALVGVPGPNEADPTGESYCFEKAVSKTSGGDGYADVWRRGYFGWEYKGKDKDLDAAYRQLLDYREDLENPPLLVVSDMHRIVIRTNFTNTKTQVYEVTLDDLADPALRPRALEVLRAAMTDPTALRPKQTPDQVTQAAAHRFALVARSLQDRGHGAEAVAHFLNRVLFCLFAEDVTLLPKRIMTDLVESRANRPEEFRDGLADLFGRMSSREASRYFGNDRIEWFNGGLFDGAPVIELTRDELVQIRDASRLDWSQVEPSILGTLFERGLDPAKRGQLGAHYTDAAKIEMIVEPVVMQPLRREFAAMQARVDELIAGRSLTPLTFEGTRRARLPQWERDAEATWRAFLDRLRAVRVLDPACGSGNFLYVTLQKLKDLEQEAIHWGSQRLGVVGEFPQVSPHNVLGIEINPYARELAGVAIWVGHIQWMLDNGYGFPRDPVLSPLDNIELRDAILARDAEGNPVPAEWPEAEFIVGNPPFVGRARMRSALGEEYVESLWAAWSGRVARTSDFVCYWHELSREAIVKGKTRRAGLLATQTIKAEASRGVLEAIRRTGSIFEAWSNEPWIVDGADVRVAIVCQDGGAENSRMLDGRPVAEIYSDLTAGATDLTAAVPLKENAGFAHQGTSKVGSFELDRLTALGLLGTPNVSGAPNSDVVVPWINASDVTTRRREMFIIDFGHQRTEEEAARYEGPFQVVESLVRPSRETNNRKVYRDYWWRHAEPRPGLRSALDGLTRFIVTPRVSKHRMFVWAYAPTLPDTRLVAITSDNEFVLGILESRLHRVWALAKGSRHGVGNDPQYTASGCFETFPFPWPLNTPDSELTPEQCAHRDAIGAAAQALDDDRLRWLNPPEWVRESRTSCPRCRLASSRSTRMPRSN